MAQVTEDAVVEEWTTPARTMLSIAQLQKSYGDVQALRGVDLTIGASEILGLLGPNGASKTTLISIVAGLLRPDSGSVWVDAGSFAGRRRGLRGLVGLAPQEFGICPTVTVQETVPLSPKRGADDVHRRLQATDGYDGPEPCRRFPGIADTSLEHPRVDSLRLALSQRDVAVAANHTQLRNPLYAADCTGRPPEC